MKAEKDKLEILQSLDHFRTWRYWKSLDDQRVCILCAKKFNGHEVQITRSDNGKYELQCPTKDCNSGPHQWVYPDAPLVPDTTEPDWWGYSPKAGTQIRDKLQALQSLDHFRIWRYWKSLDDQRVCFVCEKKFNAMRCKLRAPKTARTSFTVRPRIAIQVRISGSIRTRHRFPTRTSRAGGVIHRKQGRK